MHHTSTRQKRMTLQELEKAKTRLERRIDTLKRELITVLQGIQFVNEDLAKTLKANAILRI
jgi:chaperonin cofactor prefoldin